MPGKNNAMTWMATAGLAGVLLTGACSGTGRNESASAPAAGEAAQPAVAKLSDSDKDFLTKAAKSSYATVQLAQLAIERSKNKDVRQLAQKILEDHQKQTGDIAKLASTKGVTLPDSASLAASFKETTLKSFSGSHFDQSFLKKMIDEHQDTIALFQKEASTGTDSDVKDYATTNSQPLQEHLTAAQELANKVNTQRGTRG
jgi:putative membrane protein